MYHFDESDQMTPFYVPDTGPARLGRALVFMVIADTMKFLDDRNVPRMSHAGQALLDPLIQITGRWPIGFHLTPEEADPFVNWWEAMPPRKLRTFTNEHLGEPWKEPG